MVRNYTFISASHELCEVQSSPWDVEYEEAGKYCIGWLDRSKIGKLDMWLSTTVKDWIGWQWKCKGASSIGKVSQFEISKIKKIL